MDEYIETETSKMARSRLQTLVSDGFIHPDSQEGREITTIDFDRFLASRFFIDGGYDTLRFVLSLKGVNNPKHSLLKLCVKLNLDKEHVSQIIRELHEGMIEYLSSSRRSDLYDMANRVLDFGGRPSRENYLEWCEYFEVMPDSEFMK
jgi:hypothetical protein